MSSVTDGTSNTLMFGEYAGGWADDGGAMEFSACSIGAGGMWTAYGIKPAQPKGRPGWWQFGSMHPGVVLFCLADGSVRPWLTQSPMCRGRGIFACSAPWLTGTLFRAIPRSDARLPNGFGGTH